jgi:membrane protease YdiL (CAAX protease family)
MANWLRSLSPRAEFGIVTVLAFGLFIAASLYSVVAGGDEGGLSESGLYGIIIQEAFTLAILAPFLKWRGWSFARIGLRPGLLDSAIGVGLAAAAIALFNVVFTIAAQFAPGLDAATDQPDFVAPGFAIATVLAASALNGFFEELFLCGYVITALKERRGLWFAVNVSVAIRLTYHLYQGAAGVVGIVPLGLLFGYFYARTGRLWPLVLAHAAIDALFLLPYIY